MGLRDRGYVLDYYFPLVAGAYAAKRSRFRTRGPFSFFAPYYSGGGTAIPGNLGGGDGGIHTPIDYSIQTPFILSPESGSIVVCPGDYATSSAFASDNGQTHVASRWLVELLDTGGSLTAPGTGMFVFDSGPVSPLTSGAIAAAGLMRGASYRIQVRYKGSDGGWSDWSLAVPFAIADCATGCAGDAPDSYSHREDQTFPQVPGTVAFTVAVPAAVAGWAGLKVYADSVYWDDGGTISGNVLTIDRPHDDLNNLTGRYEGPQVLLSDDGTGAISGTVTNLGGPCTILAFLTYTGIPT